MSKSDASRTPTCSLSTRVPWRAPSTLLQWSLERTRPWVSSTTLPPDSPPWSFPPRPRNQKRRRSRLKLSPMASRMARTRMSLRLTRISLLLAPRKRKAHSSQLRQSTKTQSAVDKACHQSRRISDLRTRRSRAHHRRKSKSQHRQQHPRPSLTSSHLPRRGRA